MSQQVVFGIVFEVECCCACRMHFAMPADLMAALRISHGTFYCPAGHGQAYTKKHQIEEERDRANAAQAQLNESRHALLVAQKKLEEEKAERARIEARIHRGVCPCCNRSFRDLKAHMKTKHPSELTGAKRKEIAA